jgi:hypothetical protein
MPIGRCDACENYYVVPAQERGVCRRFPPRPVFNPQLSATDQYLEAYWPLVEADWGCGEFKKAVPAEVEV